MTALCAWSSNHDGYEILPDRDVFEPWAVVAEGDDGQRRYVSRFRTASQAQIMLARLKATAEAQSVEWLSPILGAG
jgi:hypothetical protein